MDPIVTQTIADIQELYPDLPEAKIKIATRLAASFIKEKLYIDVIEEAHSDLLLEVSLWRINTMGSEGISSESSSGISTSFSGLPETITRRLSSLKRARGV